MAELRRLVWRRQDEESTLLVAGENWLTDGLLATLPQAQLMGYVAGTPVPIVAERGALAALSDDVLGQALQVLLVDPEDRERWRVESALAGRSAARIVV